MSKFDPNDGWIDLGEKKFRISEFFKMNVSFKDFDLPYTKVAVAK